MSDGADKPTTLSTSALARQLEVPAQQLFGTLKDYGWIRKLEDGWALTAKGEFEGGEYRHSQRYGRYIVWPESLAEHPLLQALENNRMLSTAALGAPLGLSGKTVNRALAELGWLRRGFHGWELAEAGRRQGGVQLENRQTDMHYVLWPEAVREAPALAQQLETLRQAQQPQPATDLFAEAGECRAIDGHQFRCQGLRQICDWLYMAGIVHACERQLPTTEPLRADFYLPLNHLYLEYWRGDDEAGALKARMRRRECYRELGLAVIDIHPEDLEQLEDFLPRQLQKHGVKHL